MRTCKRCQLERALSFFSPHGYVCRLCKLEAVARRDNRKRRGGKAGRPRLYTAEEARERKKKHDSDCRQRRKEKAQREGSAYRHTRLTKPWSAIF